MCLYILFNHSSYSKPNDVHNYEQSNYLEPTWFKISKDDKICRKHFVHNIDAWMHIACVHVHPHKHAHACARACTRLWPHKRAHAHSCTQAHSLDKFSDLSFPVYLLHK